MTLLDTIIAAATTSNRSPTPPNPNLAATALTETLAPLDLSVSDPNLIQKLSALNESKSICSSFKHLSDATSSSELLSGLRHFLSPSCMVSGIGSYNSMVLVKKNWEKLAIFALENGHKEAAVLLMLGYDDFSAPEVCLHYVVSSDCADGIVLSAAIGRLDGVEVIGLVRYLVRWVDKYRRFLGVGEGKKEIMGFEECGCVPSFEKVVRLLGMVLDEHFQFLVLNEEVREELRRAESVVAELQAEAELSGPVVEVIGMLLADVSE